MTRKFLRYAAACGAALICLTSCGETASLVTPEVSAPASDRSFVEETEVVTTSTAAAEEEADKDTETESDTEKPFKVNVAKPRDHKIAKKSVIKDFETVLQNPELPTGCEVTSLCQTLNYLGFKIDKVKLADEFMPIDMDGSTTLDHAYIGDPKLEDGFGCFPPVIVETADTYFESIDSPCYAEDMSGIELENLLYQIEEGRPIIAWCTIDLVYFEPEHRWTTSDGEEMWFSGMQHCVTIYGYDTKKKILNVADPLKGNVEYDFDRFKEMFDLIGKKAVVICGDSETEGHYNKKKDYQRSKYLTRKELEKKEKEEAEAAKKAAEEARKAEEEAKKAEEAARIAEEEARKAEEEAARKAEEEARIAEEEAARKAEEEARKAEEEAARKAEEEARKAEEEAARKAEEEAKKAEEEARKVKEEAKKAEEAAKFAARSTSVVVTTTKTTTTKAKTTSVKTNTTKKKTTTTTATTTTAKPTTKAKTTSVKTKATKAKTTKTSTTTAAKGGKK